LPRAAEENITKWPMKTPAGNIPARVEALSRDRAAPFEPAVDNSLAERWFARTRRRWNQHANKFNFSVRIRVGVQHRHI